MNNTTYILKNAWPFILLGFIYLGYQWYQTPKFITGEKAQDFEVEVLGSEKMKLSDLRGKLVFLQFWGSWCGPCRAENQWLVPLYNEYKTKTFKNAKGLEIISIGIETNVESWRRAIEKDGMLWKYHTADFKRFDGAIARAYNIKEIPALFLLNEEGTIMLVNGTPEAYRKLLEANVE